MVILATESESVAIIVGLGWAGFVGLPLLICLAFIFVSKRLDQR
jgi:hypothetical protein